jgi:hypothetical protein
MPTATALLMQLEDLTVLLLKLNPLTAYALAQAHQQVYRHFRDAWSGSIDPGDCQDAIDDLISAIDALGGPPRGRVRP